MIRQERRRLTREYQKELDRLIKLSSSIWNKNKDYNDKLKDDEVILDKNAHEDKKIQAYYNLMKNISQRIVFLQHEITRINNDDRKQESITDKSVG